MRSWEMPRYFFDTDDGVRQTRDAMGLCLPSSADIEEEARALLFGLGMNAMTKGRDRLFTAAVRDEAGAVVYRGQVTLQLSRPSEP